MPFSSLLAAKFCCAQLVTMRFCISCQKYRHFRSEIFQQSNKLANAESAKRLIDVAEIEPALRAWAAQGNNAVLSAGERIMEAIESKHGLQLEDDDVMGHLRAALRDIAGFPKGWAQGQE